ncbi:hypothetical protein ABZP36_015328 [Zizania latifolia]
MSGQDSLVALLDTGNLVITDSKGHIVWQSFDSPTDTLLPLQSFTKDKRLVSGYYSLLYGTDNVLRLTYDGPEISSFYWPPEDFTIFSAGRTNSNSSRIAVIDNHGRFTSSDGLDIISSDSGPGINRRLTINEDGNLRLYSLNTVEKRWTVTWEAIAQPCAVHGLCGENGICEYSPGPRCSCPPGYEMADPENWSKGCQPVFTNNHIQVMEQIMFVEMRQVEFYGYDMGSNYSVSLADCEKLCSETQSCLAYSYRIGILTPYSFTNLKARLAPLPSPSRRPKQQKPPHLAAGGGATLSASKGHHHRPPRSPPPPPHTSAPIGSRAAPPGLGFRPRRPAPLALALAGPHLFDSDFNHAAPLDEVRRPPRAVGSRAGRTAPAPRHRRRHPSTPSLAE